MIIVSEITEKLTSMSGGTKMKKILAIIAVVLIGAALWMSFAPTEPTVQEPEYLSEISLELGEWYISPAEVYAKAGQVTFTVTNAGNKRHEFLVEGMSVEEKVLINGGNSETVTVNLEAGDYEVFNPIPGSKDAGMVATVHVA